ncbi:hypothetical protein HCN44_000981 [Aphidius gifuensis]|uniref:Peptidase S1 domain-containing protein n=1 Tax=Aphidius gifuensis TaxID=684658 RepID=A0A834XJN0_APHGI|nr:hypothetical protein HCN44_000981 [Aphidius gifuensis]
MSLLAEVEPQKLNIMWNKLMILPLCLCVIINVAYGKQGSKVVGGIPLTYEEHYFVASVLWQGVHVCSGTIINEFHIITTATCVTNEENIIYTNLQVLTGTFNQNDFGQYGKIDDVEFVIIHDDYAPLEFWANDISILKLTQPLVYSIFRWPIKIGNRRRDNRYKTTIMVGWERFLNEIKLVEIKLSLKYEIDCQITNEGFNFHPSQYCYSSSVHSRTKTSSGDSGNPVITVKQKYLFGMVSLVPLEPVHDFIIIINIPFYKTGYGKKADKLTGGTSVLIEEYSFQVSILWQGYHVCSGSIISELHVITTATCVTSDKNIIYGNLQILSGTDYQNNYDGYGEINDVGQIIIHDDYAPREFWANDISILKLEKPLLFTVAQRQITIQKTLPTVMKRKTLKLIGWEKFTDDYVRLSQVDIKTALIRECSKFYVNFYDIHLGQLCYSTTSDAQKISNGDSGSPMVTLKNRAIFGIVSLVPLEPNNHMFIATQTAFYIEWIEEIMKLN